jgi:hypothetical protein
MVALIFGSVGIGMLRSLNRSPRSVPFDHVEAPPQDVRVTYWCGTCGTEVLLLRKGSEAAPRHCGEAMTRREEVAHN